MRPLPARRAQSTAALFLLATVAGSAHAQDTAATLVEKALAAQGGIEALRSVKMVRLHEVVMRNAIEQSVRPEGPYFQNYSQTEEVRRFDTPALSSRSQMRGNNADWWIDSKTATAASLVIYGVALAQRGTDWVSGSPDTAQEAELSLALGPERALLTARSASDLALAPALDFRGFRHDVVSFHHAGAAIRLILQPVSHMPVAVEIVRPHPYNVHLSPWGDVTTRIEWDGWTREPRGLRYPRRWDIRRNGLLDRSVMIDQVEFDPADANVFDAPTAAVEKARQSGRPISTMLTFPAKGQAIAPGITLFEGAWNTVEVATDAGVYVVEGPISNAYSAGAIAHARATGRKLLGVITTSDSWPHIGGLREYAAEHVPIIALDLNRGQIERLMDSPHRMAPDYFAETGGKARLQFIDKSSDLGEGSAKMRLIPLRTVTGERQMAIYWPAHRLLYTSDILSPLGDEIWMPQYRDEIADVIQREGLEVETVFGMHYAPMAWQDMLKREAPKSRIAL